MTSKPIPPLPEIRLEDYYGCTHFTYAYTRSPNSGHVQSKGKAGELTLYSGLVDIANREQSESMPVLLEEPQLLAAMSSYPDVYWDFEGIPYLFEFKNFFRYLGIKANRGGFFRMPARDKRGEDGNIENVGAESICSKAWSEPEYQVRHPRLVWNPTSNHPERVPTIIHIGDRIRSVRKVFCTTVPSYYEDAWATLYEFFEGRIVHTDHPILVPEFITTQEDLRCSVDTRASLISGLREVMGLKP